jgi:hypothetical protein
MGMGGMGMGMGMGSGLSALRGMGGHCGAPPKRSPAARDEAAVAGAKRRCRVASGPCQGLRRAPGFSAAASRRAASRARRG